MQTSQGLRQTLIITSQATQARHPRERTLDDPTTGQQDKTMFGLGQFDNFQLDAMLSRRLFGLRTGITLVDKGDLYRIAGDVLHLLGQEANLGTFLLVGRSDMQRQQQSQRIDHPMDFATFAVLVSVETCPCPLSGLDWRVRPSMITALGSSLWPAATRNTIRKSSTMASNTPAARERCVCWNTVYHGGKSCGSIRHVPPLRTI